MQAAALVLLAAVLGQTDRTDEAPAPRPYHEINREVRAAFRAEAAAETLAEREGPIRELAALHAELIADPRLAESDYLTNLRGLLYSRLTRVRDDLQRQIDRDRLAQQADAPPAAAEPALESPSTASSGTTPNEPFASSQASAVSPAAALGGGAGPRDLGEELVELIQHTIAPEHWDVNGGPGAIVYYAPLQVIVVRASGEVHGHVQGLAEGLRRAGN